MRQRSARLAGEKIVQAMVEFPPPRSGVVARTPEIPASFCTKRNGTAAALPLIDQTTTGRTLRPRYAAVRPAPRGPGDPDTAKEDRDMIFFPHEWITRADDVRERVRAQ